MSPISIVLIAVGILALIIGTALWHYVIWPSILENHSIADTDFDDDDIPDQDELDEDEEYDDDDEDDEEYDDDDDEDEDMRIDGETIAELAVEVQRDYIRERDLMRALFRQEHPEYFVSVAEYRENWRAEASAYKIAVDIDRSQWRKKMGLAA